MIANLMIVLCKFQTLVIRVDLRSRQEPTNNVVRNSIACAKRHSFFYDLA
jgi:hypothetical protein